MIELLIITPQKMYIVSPYMNADIKPSTCTCFRLYLMATAKYYYFVLNFVDLLNKLILNK